MPLSAQAEPILPPVRRRFRLTSVRGCRRELAVIYAEARQARLDWQSAARAASVLQILTRMIEGDTFEDRLAALESTLAEHDRRPPSRNGHDHHARPYRRLGDLEQRVRPGAGPLEAELWCRPRGCTSTRSRSGRPLSLDTATTRRRRSSPAIPSSPSSWSRQSAPRWHQRATAVPEAA